MAGRKVIVGLLAACVSAVCASGCSEDEPTAQPKPDEPQPQAQAPAEPPALVAWREQQNALNARLDEAHAALDEAQQRWAEVSGIEIVNLRAERDALGVKLEPLEEELGRVNGEVRKIDRQYKAKRLVMPRQVRRRYIALGKEKKALKAEADALRAELKRANALIGRYDRARAGLDAAAAGLAQAKAALAEFDSTVKATPPQR